MDNTWLIRDFLSPLVSESSELLKRHHIPHFYFCSLVLRYSDIYTALHILFSRCALLKLRSKIDGWLKVV
jgi:hypothetical protein